MDAEEGQLVGLARERGAHIFSCDAHAVYETEHTGVGEWKSFTNTDVFIKIWKQVLGDAAYKDHDWTVKVDPDAVFLPDRLKQHLEGLRAPAGASLYLKNCGFKFGFMGSLEVLSGQAVGDYARDVEGCSEHLGHDGGEDFYLMSCLDAIGVGYMVDDTVLDDKYTYSDDYDLGDVSFCGSGSAAAYHPLKRPDQWQQCLDTASR
ncbi:unnamed protein product [Prorocentrum cordatum]|uniref:Hexosyltransferase n=1 Tax=Prorocentrum cordatum TaxID=2364126 RepID=A0ABN9W4R7_9DINO|nr:unnamed protein product [Polarella glacialis]